MSVYDDAKLKTFFGTLRRMKVEEVYVKELREQAYAGQRVNLDILWHTKQFYGSERKSVMQVGHLIYKVKKALKECRVKRNVSTMTEAGI